MSRYLVSKQEGDHLADCTAMSAVNERNWNTPWFFDGEVVYRDALGRKGRNAIRRWLALKCNSAVGHECPAIMLVYEDAILVKVPHGKSKALPAETSANPEPGSLPESAAPPTTDQKEGV